MVEHHADVIQNANSKIADPTNHPQHPSTVLMEKWVDTLEDVLETRKECVLGNTTSADVNLSLAHSTVTMDTREEQTDVLSANATVCSSYSVVTC